MRSDSERESFERNKQIIEIREDFRRSIRQRLVTLGLLWNEEHSKFSGHNLAAFAQCAARLGTKSDAKPEELAYAVELVKVALARGATGPGMLQPRSHSMLIWAAAKTGITELQLPLLKKLEPGKLSPQDFATTVWSLGHFSNVPAELITQAEQAFSARRVTGFDRVMLMSIAVGFSRSGVKTRETYARIAEGLKDQIGELLPQGLGFLASAFAAGGFHDRETYDEIADHAERKLGKLTPENIAELLEGFRAAGFGKHPITGVLSARPTQR